MKKLTKYDLLTEDEKMMNQKYREKLANELWNNTCVGQSCQVRNAVRRLLINIKESFKSK